MPVIGIALLLIFLLGLGVFAWQNSLPVLAVVFLGIKMQALPLSVWILIAIATGALTSGVLQVLSYLSRRPLIARIRKLEPSEPSAYNPYTKERARTVRQEPPFSTSDDASDWEDEEDSEPDAEEWDDDREPSLDESGNPDVTRDAATYEVRQEPKSSNISGSVYSFGYRDPSDSGVGKTEVVRDANYRVISRSYREAAEKSNADDWESPGGDDEDWGFEDDDEFEEGEHGDRSPRRS